MRAVIFDLDGVLVDSEPNYFEAERRLLAEYGVEFTQQMKRPYIGMSSKEMLDDVVPRFGIPDSVEALLARKNAHYLELAAKSTPVYEQTRELLVRLHEQSHPLALASGSSPEVIEVVLSAADLRDYFRVVVAAEEVEQGKPAPDLFLLAADRLGVEPADCVVVEDSAYGVQAALAAGMRCIAIPYLTDPPLDPSFANASLLIEAGMPAVDAAEVLDWIRGS